MLDFPYFIFLREFLKNKLDEALKDLNVDLLELDSDLLDVVVVAYHLENEVREEAPLHVRQLPQLPILVELRRENADLNQHFGQLGNVFSVQGHHLAVIEVGVGLVNSLEVLAVLNVNS